MLVWDPDEPLGGLTPEQIKMAKILLWKGHCSVHQMFQPQHILRWRKQHPGRHRDLATPNASFEVCKLSDYVGSTEYIIKTIAASAPRIRAGWSAPSSIWSTASPSEFKPQGKIVQFMAPTVCMCSTMAAHRSAASGLVAGESG